MIPRQLCDVYIAACSPAGGIYRYRMTENGELLFREKTPLDRPMYLALEGNRMYALLRAPFPEKKESAVVSFKISGSGSLLPEGKPLSTHGEVSAHLTVLNGRIYTANYSSGSITMLPDTVVRHEGRGPNPERQEMPHPHFISTTPDGRYLAVVDLGLDRIFVYDFSLRRISETRLPPGHGARHLAFSENGVLAFCANELRSTVSVLRYRDGMFTLAETVPALPEGFSGQSTLAAIRCDGNLLLVSHRGYDCISHFRICGEKLQRLADVPCSGHSPRDFNLFGGFLVCANEESDNAVVLQKEGSRYCIQKNTVRLPKPLCVVFRKANGEDHHV